MNINKTVAFIGNPNCGKTTLFNSYTGAKLKIANWPGVTVEKKEGEYKFQNQNLKLVDLPGIYSLNSYSIEEVVSKEYLLSKEVDVIVDVIDASSLERNLYLALQLIELGKSVVLALNMMDIVKARGMKIDIKKLSEMLGTPVIPISALKRTGLNELMECTTTIKTNIKKKALNTYNINEDENIINKRYEYIENIIKRCLINKERKELLTDKIDRIVTNKILGVPIFLCIMAVIFFLTFKIGDGVKEVFESMLEICSNYTREFLINIEVGKVITSLVVDGIIAGVGGVLTFLPNIFILFLALAFLEDSGYMARVAYVMEGIMEKIGLSGKAFIPMILGFGCTVPAIMAARTLENKGDRLKTILLIPFMSCSAKIPIYVLFSGMFFKEYAPIVAFSMYLIGLVVAIIIALIMNKIGNKKEKEQLLIELPEYKMPSIRTVWIYIESKIKDYLGKAGTTIFVASVILWILLNFGVNGLVHNPQNSFGAMIGNSLVPILEWTGLGYWQIVVALISGLAAKEIVVSSMSILYGIEDLGNTIGTGSLLVSLTEMGFNSLNALCMMIFCLLYVPCIASIAVIKKETGSIKWTIFSVSMQLFVAWGVTTLIYQIGRFFIL